MVAKPWEPAHVASPQTVRELIAALLPGAGSSPVLAGRGWDVDVWRVGDLAVRFPRRELGARCVENEIVVLPFVAQHVPVAVPTPVAVGEPGPRFPYAHFAHAWIRGQTADRRRLDAEGRAGLARPLGRLLRGLHAISPDQAAQAGAKGDALRRDLALVSRRTSPRLENLPASLGKAVLSEARARLLALPVAASEPDVFMHADLYARHLVLDEESTLSGVIDWGDVCLGDRAVDLDVVYAFLPARAREAFWDEYGEVSAATRERARFFALARHAVTLLDYALDVGDEPLAEEAAFALRNALE